LSGTKIKWNFEKGAEVMKPKTSKDNLKGRQHILRVIRQYSSRKTGTTQVEKGQIEGTKIPDNM
jgi:hypothetical protein